MKPYSTLTVSGQARRLRALAFNALTHYQLDVTRLRLVTNDMNGIFRVDTQDGGKYILRVTAPEGGHIRDHVVAEIDSFIAARGVGLANFILNDPNPEWKNKTAMFLENVENKLRRLMA